MTPRSDPATPTSALPLPDPLPALQAEFPCHRIWRENLCGRIRYIARSLHFGLNPHTVITPDPDELRAALAPSLHTGPVPAGQART